jgi:hypothetical protein
MATVLNSNMPVTWFLPNGYGAIPLTRLELAVANPQLVYSVIPNSFTISSVI